MVPLSGDLLTVTINDAEETYDAGLVATKENGGELHGLVLIKKGAQGVFFSACGPFIISDANNVIVLLEERKRGFTRQSLTFGPGTNGDQGGNGGGSDDSVKALGDPHLAGAHGIKFDVFGQPGANYSLLVAPAFEVNMQLAKRGPKLRFMTAMTVLYRGKSFTITPWTIKAKRAELIKHFESLGSKISIKDDRVITIELCRHTRFRLHTSH
jgi:hypothetical protein